MQRNFAKVHVDRAPTTWLGANFWSRAGGPLMWRSYDGDLVRKELQVLHDNGLSVTRSFCYWPDFMPTPHSVDETLLTRFADFLDAHRQVGMRTIPTYIVGHMSGENWDPAWRGGRDLYADVWMVARQAWFLREVTHRFAAHEAIAGWLVSNEMPIYGMSGPTEVVSSWAELMVQAIRAGGGHQPVSLGDGAWGIEVTGHDNGFSVRETSALVDFVGPHVYRMESDVVRQHLKAAFICELAAVGGKPVVLEEFGLSSDFASAENSGHYYRQVLHNSLLAGATGWLAWNNTDFDNLIGQDPYRHHPFEMHFGVTTVDGTPKAPLIELADFRRVLDQVDVARCERWPVETALVVSSYLESGYPFSDEADRSFVFAGLEQAHVAAREADLGLGFVRERDGIADGYRLYLLPSAKQLTGPGWLRLRELAEQGATVYVSYGAGESASQRGPWWAHTEELFGVRHRLVYGLNDPIDDDVVILTFTGALGDIEPGSALRFPVAGGVNARAYLPVEATAGEVVARDQHGHPALVINRVGAGTLVLGTFPLEYLAAAQGRVNPEPTWRIYRALAVHAGVVRPVTVDDPRVLVDGLVHADGRRFTWLVSESAEPLTVRPMPADAATTLTDPGGATAVGDVDLEPYGVRVLELTNPGGESES